MFLQRRLAQPARAHDTGEVAGQQRQAGALDGDIGAGAHGNADSGLGEGRRVVDAVARHRDTMSLALQRLDDRALVLRQHVRAHIVQAKLARDDRRRRLIVARQHDDAEAVGLQGSDGVARGRLDPIGDADERGGPPIDGEHHDRLGRGA